MTNTTLRSGKLTLVNPSERSWCERRWVVSVGTYLDTHLVVWAHGEDSALDEAIDWLADHAPGLLADESVHEEYKRAIAEGLSEDEAQERATVDTIPGDHGHYVHAWEIALAEADRAMLLALRD